MTRLLGELFACLKTRNDQSVAIDDSAVAIGGQPTFTITRRAASVLTGLDLSSATLSVAREPTLDFNGCVVGPHFFADVTDEATLLWSRPRSSAQRQRQDSEVLRVAPFSKGLRVTARQCPSTTGGDMAVG